MIRVIMFVAPWLLALSPAAALTDRQQQILKAAVAADGWLTEAAHREFWAAAPPTARSSAALAQIKAELDQTSIVGIRFQRSTWSSLKLTLAAKRVVTVPQYEADKAAMMKAAGSPAGDNAARNAEAMLEAAATGKAMNAPSGSLYVTEEKVDSVLAGLEGSLHRFRKLSNPVWESKTQEHAHPAERLKLIWDGPFTREEQSVDLAKGSRVPLTLLSFRLSESDYVAIGYMRLPAPWTTPEQTAISTVEGTLRGMGIATAAPTATRWRERVSAVAAGSSATGAGGLHASMRVVENREHRAAWQIGAISGTSLADAIRLREVLEAALNLEASSGMLAEPPKRIVGFGGLDAGIGAKIRQAETSETQTEQPAKSPSQFLLSCKFEPSRSPITNAFAKEWHDSKRSRERDVVVQIDPPAIVGEVDASIKTTAKEIDLEWRIPGPQSSRLLIIINRFSGEASETFVMREKYKVSNPTGVLASLDGKILDVAHWTRSGRCDIHPRKL